MTCSIFLPRSQTRPLWSNNPESPVRCHIFPFWENSAHAVCSGSWF
jgi:hypothetical protein